ncbi:MAG TPA: hypothetical protein VF244_01580 [Acidimicrobiales bacterium]
MAAAPTFTSTPRLASTAISTANTNRDGTGTLGSVITGVAAGTKVFEVVVEATVTTTAGMVRLFIDDGTNVRLFDEIQVTAATPSGTVSAFRARRTYDNLILPSTSHILKAGTNNAEAANVFAFAADLT